MNFKEDDIDQLLQARSEIDEELRRHKTKLTVLFTDVVGSTTYFDRFGDTAGLLLLHRHDGLVMGAVEEFKGIVVKTIGDSVMAEFTDPLHAVRAAIAIQERLLQQNQNLLESERLQIRIGINSGVGFRRGNDLFGEAVNVAARITKRSGPAQILVSRSVYEATLVTEISCAALGRVNLEGKAEAEELYEVNWTDLLTYQALRSDVTAAQAAAVSRSGKLENFLQKTPAPPSNQALEYSNVMPGADPPAPVLARYEVLSRLGSGGMGVVYKAQDRETGEIVALKVLRPDIADKASLMEGFKNELRLARRITHRNVCRIHDFNRAEGVAFISMEYIHGESLRRVLDRFSALTTRKGLKVATQICEGLREAHLQGIVHRDLKPENFMIDESGNVKLMDFGLAHFISRGSTTAVGTPSYMAPEQAQGVSIDQRADIYALGLILFEIFTGSMPFAGDTPMEVALKRFQEAPPDPRSVEQAIPEHIAKAILRCLEKEPARRFQSVDELQAALIDPAVSLPTESSQAQSKTGLRLFSRTRPFRAMPLKAWSAAGLLTASLITMAVIISNNNDDNPKPGVVQADYASSAELAAFRMAQSLDTEDAWSAFLKNHSDGKLASAATQRVEKMRSEVESSASASGRNAPSQPAAPAAATPLSASATVPAMIDSPQPPLEASTDRPVAPRRLKWTTLFDMAEIPGGVFMMGDDNGKGDEKPRHQVRVDAFHMSRTEITNRQYLAFLEETGYQRPRDPGFAKNYLMEYPDLPVVNVSYQDAVEFCAWASMKFEVSVRLPTEAEWEYAAFAGRSGVRFPWGSLSPKTMARYKGNVPREVATASRDAFPSNSFGLSNMSGNVWEWVQDFYSRDYYSISPIRNPAGPAEGTKRAIRGGSWAADEAELGATHRASRDPRERSDQIGFRIVIGNPVKSGRFQ